jgi:hypothetical protein
VDDLLSLEKGIDIGKRRLSEDSASGRAYWNSA